MTNFSRIWAMPNSKTFSILPIKSLLDRVLKKAIFEFPECKIADPFARDSKLAHITNDLDPSTSADFHLPADEFLKTLSDQSVSVMLFDPPYSPRQISECYKSMGKSVNMTTTQASFWGKIKCEISRVVVHGGYCITCGWNSGGIGKNLGFELLEVLLVPHGGWHNDTIVSVERKVK